MKFALIRDNRVLFDVEVMCAVLGVTTASSHPPSTGARNF